MNANALYLWHEGSNIRAPGILKLKKINCDQFFERKVYVPLLMRMIHLPVLPKGLDSSFKKIHYNFTFVFRVILN